MKITKELLRAQVKITRDNIPEALRTDYANQLQNQIDQYFHGYKGEMIGIYAPIGSEIKPPTVIFDMKIALPVVRNKTTLEFYPWAEGEPLAKRDFNIPIPDTCGKEPVHPDTLLIPLLLCDLKGGRIGYGAGHYDRYLAFTHNRPFLIGVCFEEQIYDGEIPAEPHDQKLNMIITPKRIIEID